MGSAEVQTLVKYVCNNIRSGQLRDAVVGLLTLKTMTKNEFLIKRINLLIVHLQAREKIQDRELDELAVLSLQSA